MIDDLPTIYQYTGDGVTTVFEYAAPVTSSDELIVKVDGADPGAYTVTLQTADGNPVDLANPVVSATVTFSEAPPVGAYVSIRQNISLVQTTDYGAFQRFPAEQHERTLDRLVLAMQRVRDLMNFAVLSNPDTAPVPAEPIVYPSGAEAAGRLLAYDATGAPVPGPLITELGDVLALSAAITDLAAITADITTLAAVDDSVVILATYADDLATLADALLVSIASGISYDDALTGLGGTVQAALDALAALQSGTQTVADAAAARLEDIQFGLPEVIPSPGGLTLDAFDSYGDYQLATVEHDGAAFNVGTHILNGRWWYAAANAYDGAAVHGFGLSKICALSADYFVVLDTVNDVMEVVAHDGVTVTTTGVTATPSTLGTYELVALADNWFVVSTIAPGNSHFRYMPYEFDPAGGTLTAGTVFDLPLTNDTDLTTYGYPYVTRRAGNQFYTLQSGFCHCLELDTAAGTISQVGNNFEVRPLDLSLAAAYYRADQMNCAAIMGGDYVVIAAEDPTDGVNNYYTFSLFHFDGADGVRKVPPYRLPVNVSALRQYMTQVGACEVTFGDSGAIVRFPAHATKRNDYL